MYSRPSGWKSSTVFFLVIFAFGCGALSDRAVSLIWGRSTQPARLNKTFAPFWEAWHLIEESYVDRDAVQPDRMARGAIDGMVNSLGDTGHTAYLSASEYKQMQSDLKGEFEGIGARMDFKDRVPTIVGVMPNTPAQSAGLRPGDVLMAVDDKDVAEMPLPKIITLVRGPEGTVVNLKVSREGEAKPIDIPITRAKIPQPDVVWSMLPGSPKVAHISLYEFTDGVDKKLKAAISAAAEQGAKGLILDLRGNPGGLRDQAVAVTSEFLKDGDVYIEQDAHGRQTPVPVEPGGVATEVPLVVLVDENSASSAEIFAGAIQDHRRGKLVGMKTFGTGTVLQPCVLSDGSALMLAVTQWLTPKGRKIWHQGIVPDVEVQLPPGTPLLQPDGGPLDEATLKKSPDKQLLKALEVLRVEIR